ncbi:MAG: metallophosphoesterase [Armatimonadota bacterium]|nr:metallophosphoesterase [Armatimonadota bacterium]
MDSIDGLDISVALWRGFGAVCGMMIVFGLYSIVWVGMAGPIQELAQELWERLSGQGGPPSPEETAKPLDSGLAPLRIVVSDLHFDFWDNLPTGPRAQAFLDFLDYVKNNPRVSEFYLNGDLMDLPRPPWQGDPVTLFLDPQNPLNLPGAVQLNFEVILQRLRDLNRRDPNLPPLQVFYCTGNHDIGISGLRYLRLDRPQFIAQVVWNPSTVVKVSGDHWVYLEHGHLQDPFLWLYLRNAVGDLLRGGQQRQEQQMLREVQRTGKSGMAASINKPATAQPGQVAGIGATLAKYRYRHAARRIFRQCHQAWGDQVKTVSFGHTHIPDAYVFPQHCLYINSGDWAQNTQNQTYLVIAPDGTVRSYSWHGRANAPF